MFLADIEKAQIEITHHIQTTAALKPKDDKSIDKVTQVLKNLNAINANLSTIKIDFHALIDAIVDYLETLITAKNSLNLYFDQIPIVSTIQSIENAINEHDRFTQKFQHEINVLTHQRQKLIEQIDRQEPNETKNHDINCIMTLLDTLQDKFSTQNYALKSRLKNEWDVQRFKIDFNLIFENIDQLKKQLNSHGQPKENSITANLNSMDFEQFEHSVQVHMPMQTYIYELKLMKFLFLSMISKLFFKFLSFPLLSALEKLSISFRFRNRFQTDATKR